MKRFSALMFVALVAMLIASCSKYSYEEVKGDPMKSRIYTLDNGLKVYMTVNEEKPRIQTYIAVRVGAKNDPAETTGLAHYFEHLMFKGSEIFGTSNYAEEKPLLDEIEQLFEVYRVTEDEAERKAIYAKIDSVSQLASQYAIPNEYDKLMAAIGASGTNAWTSTDETVYTEDIPSNQVENWAKIQADRFMNNVIRGFHTELETVYEEYNMSLTRDGNKAYYGMLELMFPNHPYGQHTVLGKQEHLKNPSITNIKNYYHTYYVPNNMAICLSGDFDPDKTIAIIDKYFGQMKPNHELPKFEVPEEEPITEPKVKEVYGLEAPFVYMAWPTVGGSASDDALIAQLVGSILSNGKCGIMDIDLNQQQKVLGAGAFDLMNVDHGAIVVAGYPKDGQTLDEVKELLLSSVAKLRSGDFDESLLASTLANYKLGEMRNLEENSGRAIMFVNSFIEGSEWEDVVGEMDELSKITKEDIVNWANKTLGENNYVILYKRQGEDLSQKKIDKPQITPISANRDAVSQMLADIKASEVAPIEPRFVDFERDMSISEMKQNLQVLYKQNTTNELFSLSFLYDFGTNDIPELNIASSYFDLLDCEDKTLEQIQREFYDMACTFYISSGGTRTYVNISGLSENMERAIELAEYYMANVKGDDSVLAELKSDLIKDRNDAKFSQRSNFSALQRYAFIGGDQIKARTLTNEDIKSLKSDDLLLLIKSLPNYKHRVMYYGPKPIEEVIATLNEKHHVGEELTEKRSEYLIYQPTPENRVFLAQYDAKQIYYMQYTNLERGFSTDNDAIIRLYNNYFSGGMNGIVFQEMREARALAYSSSASLMTGSFPEDNYAYYAFIATQNDKMRTAIEAFAEIINNMPESEAAFELAKGDLLANIATYRVTKSDVLWSYLNAEQMGVNVDRNKRVYEEIQKLELKDVVKFQQEWVKNRPYYYCILGDKSDLDMNFLRTLGPIKELTQEEIFGY